jgi:hypothetical protein
MRINEAFSHGPEQAAPISAAVEPYEHDAHSTGISPLRPLTC